MPSFHIPDFVRTRPLVLAWTAFALYSAGASVVVQFFIVPVLLPAVHAGNGLLAGGDAAIFHAIAAELAESIRQSGWSAWSLAPKGQTAAGLAAPVYVMATAAPWALIPVNAVLHATAGVIVMRLLQEVEVDAPLALAGGALWVGLPSSLQWVAQIQKSGYFFAGMLAALLGLVMLLRLVRAGPRPPGLLLGVGLLAAGIITAGAARPYAFQLMQPVVTSFAVGAAAVACHNAWRKRLAPAQCFAAIIALAAIVVCMSFAPRDTRLEPAAQAQDDGVAPVATELIGDAPWQPGSLLPAFIDRAFLGLAIARRGYLSDTYKSAGSMIDLDRQFHNPLEVIAYVPRALQVGFLAPFPTQWTAPGSRPGSAIMRLVAGIEMLVLYPLLLAGLPLAAWRWRALPQFWLVAAYCSIFIVAYACATPNVGALYRMRYGFLMTLAAVGLAALWMTLRERRTPHA